MKHPDPHAPGWELWLYRRRRAGRALTPEENAHLDKLEPNYSQFEQMADQHDEQDQLVRDEIARYPHGYGWHKGPGGGLPFDWSDDELPRLRLCDWTVIRRVRYIRVASPRTVKRPRSRVRSRVRRPVGPRRRTGSSSNTSSADPGDSDPEPRKPRLALVKPRATYTYGVTGYRTAVAP
jgi:hypothetical protein